MAVPFHVPVAGAPATSAATSSTTSSTTTTVPPQPHHPSGGGGGGSSGPATAIHHHTMPMSPANSEYLVQAFCEALYRYSRAGGSLTTPPSPTVCTNSHGNGDVFFNFSDLHDDFYGSPRRFRSHSLSIPPSSSSARTTVDMTDDESSDESFPAPNYMDENHNYTTLLREQLQEFPGRVPQRKRKPTATDSGNSPQRQRRQPSEQKHKSKPKEQKFAWPTLVCLGVLAVGCGLLATR